MGTNGQELYTSSRTVSRRIRDGERGSAMTEICNECGRSVKLGSGNFVNRVPDFNTPEERKEMGRQYPEGDFLCIEYDEMTTDEEGG